MIARSQNLEENDNTEQVQQELEIILVTIYPVLLQRLKVARFAEWHRNEDLIDDLANEAVANFCSHIHRTKLIPDNPLAYIVTISKNLANSQFRESRKEPLYFSEPLNDNFKYEENVDDVVTEFALTEIQIEKFRLALDALPKRRRQAYELKEANPYETDRELGLRMGIKEDAFRKAVSRARTSLEKILRETET